MTCSFMSLRARVMYKLNRLKWHFTAHTTDVISLYYSDSTTAITCEAYDH